MMVTKVKNTFRVSSLHLETASSKCGQCRTCDKNCPMSLPVNGMVQNGIMNHSECILCGTCVDNCPNRVIKYAWGRPGK